MDIPLVRAFTACIYSVMWMALSNIQRAMLEAKGILEICVPHEWQMECVTITLDDANLHNICSYARMSMSRGKHSTTAHSILQQ